MLRASIATWIDPASDASNKLLGASRSPQNASYERSDHDSPSLGRFRQAFKVALPIAKRFGEPSEP